MQTYGTPTLETPRGFDALRNNWSSQTLQVWFVLIPSRQNGRVDSETSHEYPKRRCLSGQRSSTPLLEVEDFCERSENEVPDQLTAITILNQKRWSKSEICPSVCIVTYDVLSRSLFRPLQQHLARRSFEHILHCSKDIKFLESLSLTSLIISIELLSKARHCKSLCLLETSSRWYLYIPLRSLVPVYEENFVLNRTRDEHVTK